MFRLAASTSNPQPTIDFLTIPKKKMVPFSRFSQVNVCVFLLLCHLSCFLGGSGPILKNNTTSFHATTFHKKNGRTSDEFALLSFKSAITHDPYQSLISWGNHSLHFCQWNGVTCSKLRRQLKVTALDLQALDLSGSLSPAVCNLTFLQKLQLSENLLSGPIPKELGLLSNLQHLNLSFNLLEGMIPHTISQCFLIKSINLRNNSFHGEIPSNISHCSNLQIIDFESNFFTGIIPTSLGALRNLKYLSLFNNLLEAKVDREWAFFVALANCSNLQVLVLSRNKLSGDFPTSIGNLSSSLQFLAIDTNQITGSIPPSISRLINLQTIYLGGNLLEGTLPQEMGRFSKLQLLSLALNQISGIVPNSLGNLSSLGIITLYGNQFGGSIPLVFQNLTSLFFFDLSTNNFIGYLPPLLGNLLSLRVLSLDSNNLSGSIPTSLGNLQSLNALSLQFNNLVGVVPSSIWNLSSLQDLQLQDNKLYGLIPPNICQTLPNLIYLVLRINHFYGPIPTSLSNCTSFELIGLSVNAFTGKVPTNLGALRSLSTLYLHNNRLEAHDSSDWAFIKSLSNCSNLEVLILANNEFSGSLPSSIGNLSKNLIFLALSQNEIGGSIPTEIKNLVGLSWLDLSGMHLTGIIPPAMGGLPSLQLLELSLNELFGEIPYTLGNLTKLNKLYLNNNNLSGHIPPTLGLCKELELLNLGRNMLIGTIPDELMTLFSLSIYLILSNNLLTGSLPSIGRLINLDIFDVSNNKLSGKIPDSVGQAIELQYLRMQNNFFEGTIPLSLEALRGLQEIDLSHNQLVGEIPKYLETFSLQYLNLSFNYLEGEVPKRGIFSNATAFSVFGNKKLCGGILELNMPACFHRLKRKGRSHLVMAITISGGFILSIILIIKFIAWGKKFKKVSPTILRLKKEQHMSVTYAELQKATNGFSSENLIGIGSFGSVYKGNLDSNNSNIVAVKVFNIQQYGASKSFKLECKTLRTARHRNLVKVLTTCSSIDYAGNDFKALVFEFMPNGCLDKWLHSQLNDGSNNRRNLNLIQRLNIAIDVACALDYLHNQGSIQIIHCDVKPSNILLDEDMVAHVGDFGLAKLLTDSTIDSSQTSTGSISLKGTIGYIAPEYGIANQVSIEGDVYSFGILLLEIFTGRRPTGEIFIENYSLHQFVQIALPEKAMSILDPRLFLQLEDEEVGKEIQHMSNISKHKLECIVSVLKIGLLCSKESPTERIKIRHALKELHIIKDIFHKGEQVQIS